MNGCYGGVMGDGGREWEFVSCREIGRRGRKSSRGGW